MVNASTHKTTWTALTVALLMLALGMASQMNAAESKHLSHKEVKELIANAREPQDHLRLAEYYNSEATRLEAESKEHEDMAEAYRHNTTSQAAAMKNPTSPSTVAHCEFIVKSLREAAKADRELAAEHEQMAKDAARPTK